MRVRGGGSRLCLFTEILSFASRFAKPSRAFATSSVASAPPASILCAAAEAWITEHPPGPGKTAFVIGIRSIGTSLSAVVARTLKWRGWRVSRATVRPGGHPFSRAVTPGELRTDGVACALIVDEGPGMSGSSMASVAKELRNRGVSDIAFLPGHAGEPGAAASAETRQLWADTRKYFVPLEGLRWEGLSVPEILARRSAALLPPDGELSVTDFGGGLWRRYVFPNSADWPGVTPVFERMKFLCANRKGDAVLWKFNGLGCGADGWRRGAPDEVRRPSYGPGRLPETALPAGAIQTPAVLDSCLGFSAFRWIRGSRFKRSELRDPVFLESVRGYLVRTAGPILNDGVASEGAARLSEMLYWNTKERLGDSFAEKASVLSRAQQCTRAPTYSDGHMAPWEWVRTAEGQVVKTDNTGHSGDHTLIGEQSLLWDLAGFSVEAELSLADAQAWVKRVPCEGLIVGPGELEFYVAAYCAFRMGLMTLAQGQTGDSDERLRLSQSEAFYRERLRVTLG